jgi:hypothetical protein
MRFTLNLRRLFFLRRKPMTQEKYQTYLTSLHWKQFRKFIFRTRGSSCEECGVSNMWAKMFYGQSNNVHHLSYANLGREHPEDVMVLCRRDHERRHGDTSLPDIFEIVWNFVQEKGIKA